MFGSGRLGLTRRISKVEGVSVSASEVDTVDECERYLSEAVDPDVWVWPFRRHGDNDPVGPRGGSSEYTYDELSVEMVTSYRERCAIEYVRAVGRGDVGELKVAMIENSNAILQSRLLLLRWEALRSDGRFPCDDIPWDHVVVQELYGDMPERLRTSGGYLERLARVVSSL